MQKQPESHMEANWCIDKNVSQPVVLPPSRIVGNNKIYTDKADVCTLFNQYFIYVGPQLASTTPQNNENPMEYIKKTPSYSFVVSSHRSTRKQTLLKFGLTESIITY